MIFSAGETFIGAEVPPQSSGALLAPSLSGAHRLVASLRLRVRHVENIYNVVPPACSRYGIGPWRASEQHAERLCASSLPARQPQLRQTIQDYYSGNGGATQPAWMRSKR